MRLTTLICTTVLLLFMHSHALAQVVSSNLVIQEGDALGGSTITGLNSPFTNGLGQVGFNAILDDGNRSIWFDGAEIFNSADAAPDVLTGSEGTMGFGNAGQFIYSPSFNGEDSVYGQDGLIQVENTQAPDFPPGTNSTFHSRPQMTDDGTAYWVSGFNDGAGGTSSIGRMLYRQNTDGSIDAVIKAGDMIGGIAVDDGSGVAFDYHFSGNNANSVIEVNLDTGSTADDGRLLVNLAVIAAEGASTGQGDNWDNFDHSAINNSGNFVFSGDTDGDTATDEFIAYNGDIQLREGDVIAAGALDGFVDSVSINEFSEIAFIWDIDDGGGLAESLLFASDGTDLANAEVLASVGDQLDFDNDGIADWILADFNAGIGPGIDLAENGLVFVEVDLESLDGATNIEAIISFNTTAIPEPGSAVLLIGLSIGAALRRRRA